MLTMWETREGIYENSLCSLYNFFVRKNDSKLKVYIPKWKFYRNQQDNSKVYMEMQGVKNSWDNTQ
jgi:hypothetical protein